MKLRVAVGVLLASVAVAIADEKEVAISQEEGTWEMAYGDVYYRVVGNVENKSTKPVKYVKLKMELLDEDGKMVFEQVGYNQKAETLGGVEGYETAGSEEEKLAKVEAIAPGEKDLFRIGVGKNEIPKKPKFKSFRITIVEVKR